MRHLKNHTDNQLILSKEISLAKIIIVLFVALTVTVVMNIYVPGLFPVVMSVAIWFGVVAWFLITNILNYSSIEFDKLEKRITLTSSFAGKKIKHKLLENINFQDIRYEWGTSNKVAKCHLIVPVQGKSYQAWSELYEKEAQFIIDWIGKGTS